MSAPAFPPLFSGMASAGADPFVAACAEARAGCDAGLVVHDIAPDWLRAAIVFAPEVPLSDASIMLPVCGIGFQNAFGAIAPPEVAVHLEWSGAIRINGGLCGGLRMAADTHDPDKEPDWLVVALDLRFTPQSENTGLTPDETALLAEGCGEVDPQHLLEAWVRHTLVWINRWTDDGPRPIHTNWKALAHGLGEETTIAGHGGMFLGLDESFGMVLKSGDDTRIVPLTDILTHTPEEVS